MANLPERALQRQKENEVPPKEKRYLHMKESEIAEWYRQARDKELQIGILADMNVTTKAVIREVLREQGIDLPEPKKNRGRARKNAEPLPVEQDVEGGGQLPPDVTETAAESCDETVQEWIPVTERLPEKSGQYIVCCDDSFCSYGDGIWYQSGVVVCAEVDVGINEGICWEWRENGTIYDLDGIVTHWMPLPQPPKGE